MTCYRRPSTWIRLSVASGLLALLPLATPSAQQPPPAQPPQRPVFRATVDLVAVEVQVVDRDGKPIPSLGVADFDVRIDGRRRKVVSADLVHYDPALLAAAAAARPPTLSDLAKKPADRMFILAVDEASFRPGDAMVMRDSARKFIDTLHDSDYVGLYKFPVIERNLDLTHGHAAVKVALSKIMGSYLHVRGEFNLLPSEIVDIMASDRDALEEVWRRECDPLDLTCRDRITQEARASAGFAEADAATRIHSLRLLLDALADVPGRKTLVVLSGGMFSSDRAVGRPDITSSMVQLGKEAAVANTALYVLHLDSSFFDSLMATGRRSVAQGDTPLFAKSFRDGQIYGMGLEQLAGAAGGGYIRIQAGAPDYAFGRVLRETSAYYLLGVEPDDRERDGRLHFLRISAKAKGGQVRGRTHVVIPRRR
jgi:VWFA-related protein